MATVGIMGAGTMGAGIAQIAAQAGWNVRLLDVSEEVVRKALSGIGKNYERLVEKGRLTAAQCDAARTRLFGAATAADFADCELIIEAVVEDLDVKVRMLGAAAAAAPSSAILASNTSSLSITKIGQGIRAGRRTVGMHFFNPVPLMKLIEIIRGLETSDATIAATQEVSQMMKKETVLINESPGFITTRLNAMIGNEAFYMLQEGVASAREIDKALKFGLNHPMGPFELVDLVGLDVRLNILNFLHQTLGEKFRPCPLLVKYVKAGRLGRKVGKGVYEYS